MTKSTALWTGDSRKFKIFDDTCLGLASAYPSLSNRPHNQSYHNLSSVSSVNLNMIWSGRPPAEHDLWTTRNILIWFFL